MLYKYIFLVTLTPLVAFNVLIYMIKEIRFRIKKQTEMLLIFLNHRYIRKINSSLVSCACFVREKQSVVLVSRHLGEYHLPLVSPSRDFQ